MVHCTTPVWYCTKWGKKYSLKFLTRTAKVSPLIFTDS
jgi:hypothetical protein